MRGISKKQFAAQQGVTPARVSQWVKSGIISILPDGSIDPIGAERDLLKNRDESKRLDWKYRINQDHHPKEQDHHGIDHHGGLNRPPLPFSGNIARDFMIMGLKALYDYYLEKMVPLELTLLRELHVGEKGAKGMAVCFAFRTHDLFKEFVEKDLFKKFIYQNTGEDIDSLCPMKGGKAETFPPKNFQLDHPKVVSDLLKEIGPDWPFDDKKKSPGK